MAIIVTQRLQIVWLRKPVFFLTKNGSATSKIHLIGTQIMNGDVVREESYGSRIQHAMQAQHLVPDHAQDGRTDGPAEEHGALPLQAGAELATVHLEGAGLGLFGLATALAGRRRRGGGGSVVFLPARTITTVVVVVAALVIFLEILEPGNELAIKGTDRCPVPIDAEGQLPIH